MLKILHRITPLAFLFIALFIALSPFLNLRVLRMAGDEKVYISTAIEMARNGEWFFQSLADEPNYFKGPLHYWGLRAGMATFGNQLIAGVWMNLFFCALIGWALFQIARKSFSAERSILLGLMGALNIGIFSHTFASQMEVELSALYALAMLMVARSKDLTGLSLKDTLKQEAPFWICTGIAGWIKSPAHCVLIAGSGFLYWTLSGTIQSKLKSPGFYLSALLGVFVCLLGYLPILLGDYQNFIETFVLRENINKANNQRQWHYVVAPLLHFAMPWIFVILAGLFKFFPKGEKFKPIARLGISFTLPTLLFWAFWTYKGQNYNLPILSALFVWAFAALEDDIPKLAFQVMGVLGFACMIGAIILFTHFLPMPDWWSPVWMIASIVLIFLFSTFFLFSSEPRTLGVGAICFFLAFGSIIYPLGEREMHDARTFMREHPGFNYFYDNLDTSIWNEWGLLQLSLHQPIYGIHRAHQLDAALKPGNAIIAPTEAALERAKKTWTEKQFFTGEDESLDSSKQPHVLTWKRWMTKGKTADGTPMWKEAWNTKDVTKLERDFYIFWIPR